MNTNPTAPRNRDTRRWRVSAGAAAAGAVLVGGAVFGATSASAAGQSPAPSTGATSAAAASGNGKQSAANPFARALRNELRVDIQGTAGFGDKAHEIAYVLIHHTKAFEKLPSNLQEDLKTLEAAAAPDRDGDAAKIKDAALNEGYGDKIQKAAKAIEAKAAKTPAKP